MKRKLLVLVALGAIGLAASATAASKEETALKARHRALTAALVRGDLKAARGYYLPGYYAESRGQRRKLDETLSMMEQVYKAGVKLQVKASLSQVVIKGDSATALETANLTLTAPNGKSRKLTKQKSKQGRKKDKGVWKLAWERSVPK